MWPGPQGTLPTLPPAAYPGPTYTLVQLQCLPALWETLPDVPAVRLTSLFDSMILTKQTILSILYLVPKKDAKRSTGIYAI